MIHRYRAYGLNCSSTAVLAGLQRLNQESDLTDLFIELGEPSPAWVPTAENISERVQRHKAPLSDVTEAATCNRLVCGSEEYFELSYADATRFVIDSAGKHLWGVSPPPLSEEDLAVYLRGPAMGFVLRRRGTIALHASAVCVGGRAVLLCGAAEAGKSMTAAALGLRGAPVLCDDIAALSNQNDEFHVESGYPRICLWPDAVRDLVGSADTLPRLAAGWEKRFLSLDETRARFEPRKRPIAAIYLLGNRSDEWDAPRIDVLSSREALLGLIRNTYMNWVLDQKQRAAEFDVLSEIARRIPIRRVVPHVDAAQLSMLCDLILGDAQQLITRQDASEMAHDR